MNSLISLTNNSQLRVECQKLHMKLFSFSPSEDIITHYINAHSVYHTYIEKKNCDFIALLCKKDIDLEALEYYWRFLKSNNTLTQKKMVLISICEFYPEYKSIYVNFEADNFLGALLILFKSGFRSIMKLIKGLMIFYYYKGKFLS